MLSRVYPGGVIPLGYAVSVPRVPMQRLFSATGPPSNLVAAVHAHRQAQWQVGHGLLGLPNRTGYPNCKPRQDGSGGEDRGMRRVHRDVKPAARASVRYGDVLDYGMAANASCAPDGGS